MLGLSPVSSAVFVWMLCCVVLCCVVFSCGVDVLCLFVLNSDVMCCVVSCCDVLGCVQLC